MVATLSLRVMTGAAATTISAAQSGISFLAIDSANNDLATRQANPITVGSNSFEKHLRLYIDTPPNTNVSNFRFYTDGSGTSNVALKFRVAGTGGASPGTGDLQPVSTTMSGTDAYTITATNYNTGSPPAGQFDGGTYTSAMTGYVTKALVLQLQVGASATPGAWPQELLYLVYDES